MKKKLVAVLAALSMVCTLSTGMPANAAPEKEGAAGTTYYVSTVNGNDNNDGTSKNEAFYSLDKINELTLQPGDQVLLECGSVFENGYLHLKGSGSEGAPIIVDKYGEGNMPVINTNGQGIWYQNYRAALDSTSHKWYGYVSSSILLYDVEYIEINNLEIVNEAPEIETTYNALDVMNRTGVAAVAQNIGTADHIYLNNLYVHDVVGNVYDKHMNNGGIYFTQFTPDDESATGIARYNDVKIENCYVDNVNRWGIAVGYTYQHGQFTQAAISDETIATYGSSNVQIRNNYIKDAGGDSITLMYCDRPITEYNVSDGAARQINTTDYALTASGRAAAGIWPWKCKDAVFQYNEAFDTCDNQDGQAWDADSGDGTVYQYNYSHNNAGGSVMFCLGQAIHNTFRYNISQNDGVAAVTHGKGIINPCGQPDAHIYNNTFYVAEGVDFIRTNMAGGAMVVENNIIYYSGDSAKEENWFKDTNTTATSYDNNLYYNYSNTPSNDTNPIVADPLFENAGNGPTAPKTGITAGAISGDEYIVYDRDAFDGYKVSDDSPAVNAGKAISNNGGIDFFGNEVKGKPDIGAYESGVVSKSDDNEIKEAVYMIKGDEIYVPSLENNPTAVKEVLDGITVDAAASAEIRNAEGEKVTSGDSADGMKLVVIAENGEENELVIKVKNTYQWALDYAGPQQGNVWFGQIRNSETEYANLTEYDPTYPNWVVDQYYGPGIDLPNHSTPTDENTHGLLSDTTRTSKREGMAMAFRVPKSGKITLAVKDDEPYLRQAGNTGGSVVLSFTKNGEVIGDTYTLEQSNVKADVEPRTLEVQKGDWIRVEAKNVGTPTRPSVHVTPIITYLDETPTPVPDTEAPTVPSDVSAANIEQTTADISWTASEDNEGVVKYEVYNGETLLATVENTSVSLEGLTAGTEYMLSVFAYDAAGNKSDAGTVTFTTKEDEVPPIEKPEAPEVIPGKVTENSAAISWDAVENVSGYRIYVNGILYKEVGADVTSYVLEGLEAGTEYRIAVAAFNEAGETQSTEITVATEGEKPVEKDTEAPTAPSGVKVDKIGKTEATLSWNASKDNVGVIGYHVYNGDKLIATVNDTSVVVKGLAIGTKYTLSVKAYDLAGNESEAGTVTFTTKKDSAKPDPEKPASGKTESVKTGDNSNIMLYVILLGVSLAGVSAVLVLRKKRK